MNQYRVSLWIENQGSIPDFDVQFQVINAAPDPSTLVIAAFFLAGRHWARLVEVQVLSEDQWVVLSQAAKVTMYGASEIWFNGSSAK